ncbi:zinc-ribbon domain-containing protein [Cronobacter dublinensis]|jgi:primosomal protein N'|uniref:Zinc-ribbon domain-containing protein n=1 Tax=Cronobacter sakazakii TaxID=28141 RepID=A0AAN5X621_CROSK|nr:MULTISPECIES: zinc-ribbon domain-containing protein [Cronobacter]EGT5713139.1 zinc-ribbon domain-containing protein [Cronobacter dublinensis subsp. dublinensis]EKM5761691.1 zinc-ribbon domain-containing protein [Cronobacter turicensis]EGT5722614.1 zinc-ribbon domain-containing protein [Cronobacter sakazakii]EGT5738352.1 zinc-ribbon domain-containing protein [Cronobacter dublinensis subsp. dublinensis]EJG0810270.1 zinc-ribbon domain-containing protein [Cronobacter sakazakii]
MALIKCKECGAEVSSKADVCPKCGAPFKLRVKGPSGCMMILLVIIGVLFTIFFIAKMS